MIRSFRFRLYPTVRQEQGLATMLELHAELYNAALEERREAWRRGRHSVSYFDQCTQLPVVRSARPDVGKCGNASLQRTLRKLDRAFAAFYRRVKHGDAPGYPRFRSARRFDSMEAPYGSGSALRANGKVYWMGVGEIRVRQHRPILGTPKIVRIKREGRRWFAIVACEDVPTKPLPATGKGLGVDLGITHFLTTSEGEHIVNPRFLNRSRDQVTAASRMVARARSGSNRRSKAVALLAETHRRTARRRRDFAHKTALGLVRSADLIVVEDLAVERMSRSAGGTVEQPGVNVAAKRGLNRSIRDAGWASFLGILEGKAEEAGREVLRVNPRRTSQTCAECQSVDPNSRDRGLFRCTACGHENDADVNAARNILRAGVAQRGTVPRSGVVSNSQVDGSLRIFGEEALQEEVNPKST